MTLSSILFMLLLLLGVHDMHDVHEKPEGHRTSADIQFIHALVGVGPLDLYMNGQPFATGQALETATAFSSILSGDYAISLYTAGTDTSIVAPLAAETINIASRSRGVIAAIGHAGAPVLLVRFNVRKEAQSNLVELFLIHGAPDTGPVDLRLRDPADNNKIVSLLYNDMPYARASVYMRIQPKSFNYEFVQSATNAILGTYFLNVSGFVNRCGVLVIFGRGTSPSNGLTLVGFDADGARYQSYNTTHTHREPPAPLSLGPVYPNPFSNATRVFYTLESSAPVTIRITDMLGRAVATLYDGWQVQGTHAIDWDGHSDLRTPAPSGVYLVQFQSHDRTFAKTLLRTR